MNVDVKIAEICCHNCGIVFWVLKDHHSVLLREKRSFYCPSGHCQAYTGKSDKKKYEELKAGFDIRGESLDRMADEQVDYENKIRIYKGVISRLKKKKVLKK